MRSLLPCVLAAALLLTSCSRDREDDERPANATSSSAAHEDVRIQTTKGELDMALIGDTISAGLAPGAVAKVRQETDTAAVHGSGLGGSIERLVKSTVQSAVTSRVSFPVSAVKDVRYRNGAIEFEWKERPTRLFEHTKVNGKPFLESFSPADAERFVQAVRAKLVLAQ
jgi:hypothetical protein